MEKKRHVIIIDFFKNLKSSDKIVLFHSGSTYSFILSVLFFGTFQTNAVYSLISHSFPNPLQSGLCPV